MDLCIINGFLGSGKTTLLQNILEKELRLGRKVAVLLNEVGSFSVDTHLLDGRVPLSELLDGCICCTLNEELEEQVLTIYKDHQPEVLYIETTGVAHPLTVLDACYSPVIASFLNRRSLLSVVDTSFWSFREELGEITKTLLEEQVKFSNLVILNKVSEVDEQEKLAVIDNISSINRKVRLIECNYGETDIDIFANSNFITNKSLNSQGIHKDHHLHLQTYTHTFNGKIDKTDFDLWRQSLPKTIYRVKGFVPLIHSESPVLFQYSYGHESSYEEQPFNFSPTLVFIGINVNLKQLNASLESIDCNKI